LKAQSIDSSEAQLEGIEKLEAEPPADGDSPAEFLDKLQLGWSALGKTAFTGKPESKLSDTALTGVIAGLAMIWFLDNSCQEKPPEVANLPASEPMPLHNYSAEHSTDRATTNRGHTARASATPTPTLELTPEQNLIASIENQVAEITDRYADGLIQSIQATSASNYQSR